jgi:hypothetical protein
MLGDALLASIADLGLGFAFACILALIAFLIRSESHAAHEGEPEPQIEEEDIWAGLTPDRDRRAAEARFDEGRRAA